MTKRKTFPAAMAVCFLSFVPQIVAQNSIQLFGPVNVRPSATTTSYSSPVNFNSNTLNLSCPASPRAVLSSTSDSTGYVLADNNINVTVTVGDGTTGPTNVCTGGSPSAGPVPSCFSTSYQNSASAGQLNTVDPDTLLPGGGVPPLDISTLLTAGTTQQVKFDLQDEGGWLASSTLYLNTNCTSGGVSAPATISGNTIPPTNPTPQDLKQDFPFNPVANNGINFEYDLTTAQNAGTLAINPDGAIPSVADSSLDPATFQPTWVTGTSFATSMCLVHDGEILPSGAPGCKLYTLDCTVGTGNDARGANCPVSTAANEAFRDIFDGPAFTLPDIVNVNGPTFHEGMGFLMAGEPWTGGACQFAVDSGFQNNLCPMNILSTFTGPGSFGSNGTSTHPNSTFITIAGVPEDLTTIQVEGMHSGWVNTSTPTVTFSSQPPTFAGVQPPPAGAANFVASPIQSITYGISAANNVPAPGAPVSGDQTLTDSSGCPTPTDPTNPPATTFTPSPVTLGSLEDGQYALHYFAQDCAGTLELKFVNNGSWSTNFYTFPINVDTTPPVVTTPTLSPAGPYYQGQPGVTATFSCTDSLSGVAQCTSSTGKPSPAPVDTSMPGSKTFTADATDVAGNHSSASLNYTVTPVDGQVQLTLSSGTVTYPLGTNLEVLVSKINSHVPKGTVTIVDNGVTTLTTLSLNNAGDAFFYVKNISAGMHNLTAVYSGDSFNPGGTSAPMTLNVLPVPVTQSVACWNTPFPYGSNFQCNVHETSTAGAAQGSITYVYDTNAQVSVPLASGAATIVIPKPPVGNHTVVISYPAQTNFAATGPQTVNFVVTAH